jgi:hypothetical protein
MRGEEEDPGGATKVKQSERETGRGIVGDGEEEVEKEEEEEELVHLVIESSWRVHVERKS